MSWQQRFNQDGPVIDPFNAPDPVMPGGEPELEPRDGDGVERMAARNERKEPGHHRHRARLSAPARTGSAQGNVSPVTEDTGGTSETRRPARPARGDRRTGARRARSQGTAAQPKSGRRNRLGCIVALIVGLTIAVNALGLITSGCTALIRTLFSDDGPSYEYDAYSGSYETYDMVEATAARAGRDAMEDALDRVVAADEPYLSIASEGLEDRIFSYTGKTADELGIDTLGLARTLLESSTYTIEDDPYVFPSTTADGYDIDLSGYFYLYVPDFKEAISQLSEYLWDNVPRGGSYEDALNDEVLAGATGVIQTALDTAEPREYYLSVSLTGTADADGTNVQVALDTADWEQTFRSSVMGLY